MRSMFAAMAARVLDLARQDWSSAFVPAGRGEAFCPALTIRKGMGADSVSAASIGEDQLEHGVPRPGQPS